MITTSTAISCNKPILYPVHFPSGASIDHIPSKVCIFSEHSPVVGHAIRTSTNDSEDFSLVQPCSGVVMAPKLPSSERDAHLTRRRHDDGWSRKIGSWLYTGKVVFAKWE